MKKMIKSLIFEHQQTKEYLKDNECREEENYRKALEKFAKSVEDEDLIANVVNESEDFGFIQGFKCAMLLKKECGMI